MATVDGIGPDGARGLAMTAAYILMAHDQLAAAGALANQLAAGGRPVAVHIDRRTPDAEVAAFQAATSEDDLIEVDRRACEWGMFSLVDATLDAAAALLKSGGDFTHVMLVSGADLPARPLADLDGYLAEHPLHDIIESNELSQRRWVQDGLVDERFHLYHPFSWRKRRKIFDLNVELQRALKVKRTTPERLDLALGSQWWCLRRETLNAILDDPQLPELRKWWRWTWIPDESFFQTMVRRHGKERVNRSPTLSRFDPRGLPYVFYDDHTQLLAQSDHFFIRKVHPRAHKLRENLLAAAQSPEQSRVFRGKAPDEEVSRARRNRTHGREHLLSPARFTLLKGKAKRASAFPYSVIGGVGDETAALISRELTRRGDITCHERLFAPNEVRLHNHADIAAGGVPAASHVRDFWPDQYVINLARGAAGSAVAFCLPVEDRYAIGDFIAADPGARIIWFRGAWALDLYRSAHRLEPEGLADRARDAGVAERGQLAAFRKAGAALTIRSAADLITEPEECIAEMLEIANARASSRRMKPPTFEPENWEKARPFLRFLQKSGCEVEAGLLNLT
ncbi:MAG: beta-1,6-N-acetylglucosaminyltransferase [Pikeienuella sp.]